MALVGYTPHPAGGHVFHRDDGQSMHFTGPEAEGLRQYIDATKPPDVRTAENTPTVDNAYARDAGAVTLAEARQDAGASNAMLNPTLPARYTPPAAAAPPAPAPAPAAPGAAPAPAPAAAPAAAPGAAPAPAGEPVDPNAPAFGNREAEEFIWRPKWVPGSPGFSATKEAARRHPVPVARTVTGGLNLTAEEQQQHLEDARAFHTANQAAFQEIQAAGAERVAAAEDARRNALHSAMRAEQDQREALAKRDAVENTWNTTNARLGAERDAVAEQRVDPNRLFRGPGGALAALGSALSVGLGAFGSGLTKTPNYAQQIVDNTIQRDVNAQVDDIHRRGAAAQNAIADFQRTYGLTLDEARTAVKATQLRYAASMADMTAARIGTAEAKQQAAVMKAKFLQGAMMDEAALKEMYSGRMSNTFAMMADRAATRGHFDSNLTSKDVKERSEAAIAARKAGGTGGGSIQEERMRLRLAQDERERRVPMPEGPDLWANRKEDATEALKVLHGGEHVNGNLKEMASILEHMGSSIDPEMKARYDFLAQENKATLKDVYGFRVLTETDEHILAPMTGETGNDFISWKNSTRKRLQSSEQNVNKLVRAQMRGLYTDKETQHHVSESEGNVGIKVTGSAAPRRYQDDGTPEPADEGEAD